MGPREQFVAAANPHHDLVDLSSMPPSPRWLRRRFVPGAGASAPNIDPGLECTPDSSRE
jgi:hypothetical protein